MGKRNQECSKTSRAYQHEKVWSGLWVSQWSNRFCWRNSKEAMAIQQWGRYLGLIAGGVGLLCPSRSSLDEIHLQSPLSQLPLPLMTPSLILSHRNSLSSPPPHPQLQMEGWSQWLPVLLVWTSVQSMCLSTGVHIVYNLHIPCTICYSWARRELHYWGHVDIRSHFLPIGM